MDPHCSNRCSFLILDVRIILLLAAIAFQTSRDVRGEDPKAVVTADEWQRIDSAVDRGLAYLARQQRPNGSIDSPVTGQPGITSLAVLAFLSRGHVPGDGPYGDHLFKAVDYVLGCQRRDGLLSAAEPEAEHVHDGASHAGNYNHAISALMLTEVYGMLSNERAAMTAKAIVKAIEFSRSQQTKPKVHPGEEGGWRYIRPRQNWEADISVTAWQIMFYRSAKNGGFDVPVSYVDEAMGYIRRGFDPQQNAYVYNFPGGARLATRGVVGGAIVSLALGGEHDSEQARSAAEWVLKQRFHRYNQGAGPYHYGAYYCSQAMFQLGGDYWKRYFPELSRTLVANQRKDGAWDRENDHNGDYFGQTYTTSLAILALTPAYQLLPIYQR